MAWRLQTWWYPIIIFFFLPILSFLWLNLFLRVNRNRAVLLQWPVVGMLPGLLANFHRLPDFITSMLRESGGTFMFKGPWLMGLDLMFTCDPANAKHMFTSHYSNYIKGRDFPEIFDILGEGIITSDGERWAKQRRMANAHMSSHNFRSSVAKNSRDKVETSVLPLLGRMADLDQAFDLQEFLQRLAMDLVTKLVVGRDPGSLAPDFPRVPFVVSVGDAEEVIVFRHFVPCWKLLKWLDVGIEKKMSTATNVINKYIAQCIDEKRNDITKSKGREESKDILTSYMYHIMDNEEGDYFSTDKFVRDTLMTLLAAGTDSSAAALAWFFWQVSKRPDVEDRILEELRESVRIHKVNGSSDAGGKRMVVFDVDSTEGLVYLHAALCETLRLFPSFPFNAKTADKEDVLPSGHRVRRGATVIYSTYSMGRLEKLWGEDCLEFKPERWIDSSSGQLKHVNSHDFLAFHTGPRSCIGRNMAMTQMKVIAAAVTYNFRVEVVKSCVIEPKTAMVLLMKNGLKVKVRKREGPC